MGNLDDYIGLTTNAKIYGGPEKYIEFLQKVSRSEGRDEGIAIGLVVGLAAGGSVFVFKKGFNHFKKRKKDKILEVYVRQELINGMNESADNKTTTNVSMFDTKFNDLSKK